MAREDIVKRLKISVTIPPGSLLTQLALRHPGNRQTMMMLRRIASSTKAKLPEALAEEEQAGGTAAFEGENALGFLGELDAVIQDLVRRSHGESPESLCRTFLGDAGISISLEDSTGSPVYSGTVNLTEALAGKQFYDQSALFGPERLSGAPADLAAVLGGVRDCMVRRDREAEVKNVTPFFSLNRDRAFYVMPRYDTQMSERLERLGYPYTGEGERRCFAVSGEVLDSLLVRAIQDGMEQNLIRMRDFHYSVADSGKSWEDLASESAGNGLPYPDRETPWAELYRPDGGDVIRSLRTYNRAVHHTDSVLFGFTDELYANLREPHDLVTDSQVLKEGQDPGVTVLLDDLQDDAVKSQEIRDRRGYVHGAGIYRQAGIPPAELPQSVRNSRSLAAAMHAAAVPEPDTSLTESTGLRADALYLVSGEGVSRDPSAPEAPPERVLDNRIDALGGGSRYQGSEPGLVVTGRQLEHGLKNRLLGYGRMAVRYLGFSTARAAADLTVSNVSPAEITVPRETVPDQDQLRSAGNAVSSVFPEAARTAATVPDPVLPPAAGRGVFAFIRSAFDTGVEAVRRRILDAERERRERREAEEQLRSAERQAAESRERERAEHEDRIRTGTAAQAEHVSAAGQTVYDQTQDVSGDVSPEVSPELSGDVTDAEPETVREPVNGSPETVTEADKSADPGNSESVAPEAAKEASEAVSEQQPDVSRESSPDVRPDSRTEKQEETENTEKTGETRETEPAAELPDAAHTVTEMRAPDGPESVSTDVQDETAGNTLNGLRIEVLSVRSPELTAFTGLKPDEKSCVILEGEDAVNYLALAASCDRTFSMNQGGHVLCADPSMKIRICAGDGKGILKSLPVNVTFGDPSNGSTAEEFVSRLFDRGFAGEPLEDEASLLLKGIREDTVRQAGETAREGLLPGQQADAPRREAVLDPLTWLTDEEMVAITRASEQELSGRIYLDYVPSDLLPWATRPDGPVSWSSERNQFFIHRDDAVKPGNAANVARCRRRREIYGDDFAGKVTDGKIALAQALNIRDRVQREFAVADALSVCAREAASGVDGAITRFEQVLSIDKNIGRRLGFVGSFRTALRYYRAVDRIKNEEKAAESEGRDADARDCRQNAGFAEDRARFSLMKSALTNASAMCLARVGAALSHAEKGTPDPRLPAVAAALSDYARSVQQFNGERISCRHFGDFNSGHSDQTFMRDLRSRLAGVPGDARFRTEIETMGEEVCRACSLMERSVAEARSSDGRDPEIRAAEAKRKMQTTADNLRDYMQTRWGREPEKKRHYEIPLFDVGLKPLYLAVPENRRVQFAQGHPEVCQEPLTGLLCVEDTPENRKTFADLTAHYERAGARQGNGAEEIRSRALRALSENGFSVPAEKVRMDGRWHADPGNKSRSYVINLDGVPRMQLMDLNGSLNRTVKLGLPSEEEKREIRESYQQMVSEQEAEAARQRLQKSEQVRQILEAMGPDSEITLHDAESAYLQKKGLREADIPGVRFDAEGKTAAALTGGSASSCRGALICPMTNAAGKVKAAEIIDASGKKRFAGPLGGNFYTVGGYEQLEKADTVLICEGVATAASIARSVPEGVAVVACMSSSNMEKCALSIVHRFPEKGLGIMIDNDMRTGIKTGHNAGQAAGYKTRKALENVRSGVPVIYPCLTARELRNGLSDFNDAMLRHPDKTAVRVRDAVRRVREQMERIRSARRPEQMAVNDSLLTEQADHRRSERLKGRR